MKLLTALGATSQIWQVFIQDTTSSVGVGLTGLTCSSASLTAYYHRDTDTTATAISLTTMTVGTFTSSGFKQIDSTNMPGWYQFCPPNAALASGAKNVGFHLQGATSMAPLPIEAQLVAFDPNDAVGLGLTALPNAASGAAGAIITSGTGTAQISVSSGAVIIQDGTGSGQIDTTSGLVQVTSNIKKNSASRITFVMTDSTTHAPKTGCTVTAQVSLDGGALGSCTNSVSEIGSGLYTLVLAAADTNANELAYR